MRKNRWPLLIVMTCCIIAGGVFFLKKVTLLQLENLDQGKALHIRVTPSESFSMFYIHSIYLEPVFEEFRIDQGAILLEGVRTKSVPIMEYYGFEDIREFHPIHLRLGAIYLKWGSGEGQGLIIRERKIYLSEMGQRGDRIRLRTKQIPLGYYLFQHLSPSYTKRKEGELLIFQSTISFFLDPCTARSTRFPKSLKRIS